MFVTIFRYLLVLLVLMSGPAGANAFVLCVENDGSTQIEFAGISGGCSPCEVITPKNHNTESYSPEGSKNTILSADGSDTCLDLPLSIVSASDNTLQNPAQQIPPELEILFVDTSFDPSELPEISPLKPPILQPPSADLFLKKRTVLII